MDAMKWLSILQLMNSIAIFGCLLSIWRLNKDMISLFCTQTIHSSIALRHAAQLSQFEKIIKESNDNGTTETTR